MRPPSGVNFTALDRRFSTICLSRRWSAVRRMPWPTAGGEREPLVVGAPRHHAHGVVEEGLELDLLGIEPDAAGLDLRHVEDVVDDVEQVLAALVDVAAIFAILVGAERAEHAGFHDLGESDDGIERGAQLVAHIGEESRLGLVGFLGAGLLLGIFLGEIGDLLGLPLQLLLRVAQIGDGGHQALLALHQLFFVQLDVGDVGADRDVAAVLGAALADVQPAAVVELRLEGAGARALALARHLRAHHRLASGRHHGLVGRAGLDRRVRQIVQLLEVRVAQHEAVLRVPHHERFRDGLDGVAQPQVRLDRALDQCLLLGDVDRDADQMRAGLRRAAGPARSARAARPSCRWRGACGRRGRPGWPWRRRVGPRARRDGYPRDGPGH